MAKETMVCPISGRACKNCCLFIGRHYFMCYAKSRSHGPERVIKIQTEQPVDLNVRGKFELPDATGFDPFVAQLQRE
jgi:hypothetical protein